MHSGPSYDGHSCVTLVCDDHGANPHECWVSGVFESRVRLVTLFDSLEDRPRGGLFVGAPQDWSVRGITGAEIERTLIEIPAHAAGGKTRHWTL